MEPHWPRLLGPKLYDKDFLDHESEDKYIKDKLKIRVANEDDLFEIASFDRKYFDSPWSYEAFKNEFNNSTSFIFIGELDKKTIAYLVIRIVSDEMEILKILVEPDYRRKGIARSLLNKALEIAQDLGLNILYLEVSKKNLVALSLYKSFGFKEYEIRKDYYAKGEDAILMKLELPSDKEEQAA